MDPSAILCCGANGNYCADDAGLPVERQEYSEVDGVVEMFPKCTPRRNIVYLEQPHLSLAKKHVDFEGNDLKFTINYPINSQAFPTKVQIGNTTISNLNELRRSVQGHLSLVVRAILDQSMNGHMCACVQYLDADLILHHKRLTAEVVVLHRQTINKKSVEYKGRIRSSISSLNVGQNNTTKQHYRMPRSNTVEEIKNSDRYHLYCNRLRRDGIFVKPRPADSDGAARKATPGSYCLPAIQIWPDVYDFQSPAKTSFSNGLLTNHLNGVPIPRQTKSLNGSPAHTSNSPDCLSSIYFDCESYQRPPSSPEGTHSNKPVPVITIRQERVIRRSRSFESLPRRSLDYAEKEIINPKDKMNRLQKLVDYYSGRTQGWFCFTQRLWFRVKHEYRTVSDGIQRMNRENR